jgi:hypothetical protein
MYRNIFLYDLTTMSPLKPGLDRVPVHVEFVVGKVELGRLLLLAPQFSPISVTSPLLCIDSRITESR